MNFARIRSTDDWNYDEAMELYREYFPEDMQRSDEAQAALMKEEDYHFTILYEEDMEAGFVGYWEAEKFLYLEHICVDPMFRHDECGKHALEALEHKGKKIIVTVGEVTDVEARKLAGYFQRAGFWMNPYPHTQGSCGAPDTECKKVVMSGPDMLTEEEYQAFNEYMHEKVMKA